MPIANKIRIWIGLVKEGINHDDSDYVTNTIFFTQPAAEEWAENITKGLSKFDTYEELKAFCKQYKIPIDTLGVEIQEVDVEFPKGWMVVMPGPNEK